METTGLDLVYLYKVSFFFMYIEIGWLGVQTNDITS